MDDDDDRIAGYHGWGPQNQTNYCQHGQETFPGWHRAYLSEFEQALRAADRALGNDGRIGLPYWDVLGQPRTAGGEVFPKILREHFGNGTATVRALESCGWGMSAAGVEQRSRILWRV